MQAVGVIPSKKEVGVLEHSNPEIRHDDVVRVRCLEVGICGTDREICTFVYGQPPEGSEYLILGHESLGEVIDVGSAVKNIKVGDLVVPSVRRPCEHQDCQPCRAGLQDFCATGDFVERGIKARHGYMTEEYSEHEQFLYVAPKNLRDVAVLVEPLTIAEKAMAQVWLAQQRLPWVKNNPQGTPRGKGLKAVVLGAGPIGILGAMKMVSEGFDTYVYSRSRKPNPKAALVEAVGAKYISALDHTVDELVEMVGNIDLVYEAIGVSSVAYDVLRVLGNNGAFVFTGIPAPKPPIEVDADLIMRNVVLKNQVIIGSVNADAAAFEAALADLDVFVRRWPETIRAVITGRFSIDDCQSLLLDKAQGIKNVVSFT